jgi:hypothetical protein
MMSADRLDLDALMDRFESALPKAQRTTKYRTAARWQAEDGWIIGYTTSRCVDGPHDGKFLVFAYRPYGPGARTDPATWRITYERSFAKRRAAKARALVLLGKHSPKWKARWGHYDAKGNPLPPY